jgi:hypothetical protein
MLIAHLEHGEVYVPSIEKTFLWVSRWNQKKSCRGVGFFSLARVDTGDLAGAAALMRDLRGLDST